MLQVVLCVFAAADTSTHRERFLSLIHAANRKLRLRDSKSRSVENEAAFVPSIASSRSKSTTYVHHIPTTAAEADASQTQQADSAAEQLDVGIRRYPAYHYDNNQNAVSSTTASDGCKSSLLMRRAARSYESLSNVRIYIPANSSRSGCTLPMAYRSLNS